MSDEGMGLLHVLVVEDEPIAAEAHTAYVERVPGFTVAATVGTSQAAMMALQERQVDVVLLDMNLPDRHGLEVIRAMRAGGHQADVIALTSARDLEVVRAAVSLGVVQYVLKPFVFATLRERLLAYRAYREQVQGAEQVGTQAEVDEVIGGLRSAAEARLPKGMGEELLARVSRALREADRGAEPRARRPGAGEGHPVDTGDEAPNLRRVERRARVARHPVSYTHLTLPTTERV